MATHPAGRGDGCAVPPWGSPESVAAAVKGKQERRAPRPTPPMTEGHASLLVARQLRLPAQRRSWLGPSGRPGLACAAGNSPQLCSLLSKKNATLLLSPAHPTHHLPLHTHTHMRADSRVQDWPLVDWKAATAISVACEQAEREKSGKADWRARPIPSWGGRWCSRVKAPRDAAPRPVGH